MRTAHIVLCASALLLSTGAFAAGCISNSGAAPGDDAGADSALPGLDGGFPLDSSFPFDATVDAPFDAAAVATLSTSTIDFGLVNCGTGTASQTYSFTNSGPVPITYAASIASGSVFSIDGASSGSVAPGASASITLAVGSIPTTSVAGTALTSTLSLTTNVPGFTSVSVPLSVTPQGGSLTVSPAIAGFGQVQLANDGTPIPLTISNVGNAPVTVTFGAPTDVDGGGVDDDFAVTYPGSPAATALAAGATLADAGATFLPTTAGLRTVTSAIQTTDPLCASEATAVTMSGNGSTAHVTVGPDPIQFGTVLCGQTGSALTVTIKNSSPDAVSFTASLTLGTASSPFKIDVTSGTVPGLEADGGDGVAIITITPKTVPVPSSVVPNAINDTLVVTPDAPGVTATSISLQESAAGAILAVAMPTTAFNTVINTTDSLPFNVTNTGNRDAPLGLVTTGTGYASAFTATTTATADGGTAAGKTSFTATTNTTIPGSVTVTTTAVQCGTAPTAIGLTATGEVPVASFPGTTLDVTATCGNGTTTQASVIVTNTGKAPMTLSGVASKNGHFTVFSFPTTIAGNNGTGTIVIQAAPINLSATTTLSDTLTFTTNEVGSPSHTVPVTVTASGANLSVVMANTNFNTVSTPTSLPFSVVNSGNVAAPLVLTPGGSGYSASFTGSSTANAGGSAAGNATFTPPGDGTFGGSLLVTTSAVLCSVSPPSVTLAATGSVAIASFPATTIAIGAICGGGATTGGSVIVTNNGTNKMTLTGVSSKNGTFTISSFPATIAANGGTGTIAIQAASLGQGTAGGSTLNDTLDFTTNEVGNPTRTVPVTVAVSGANLSFVGGASVTIGPGCGGQSYSVQNTGNMTAFVTGTGNYPNASDSFGDTGVFDFEDATFQSATQIAVGTPVSDNLVYGDICGLTPNPCILTGTQTYSTLNGAGTSVGICIPLPNLSLEIAFTAQCGNCC